MPCFDEKTIKEYLRQGDSKLQVSAQLRAISRKPLKNTSSIEQIIRIIDDNDLLHLIANFQLICTILRPLLITWKRRDTESSINAALLKLFEAFGQKVYFVNDKLSIILPQYQPFCKFASQIIGTNVGEAKSSKIANKQFPVHQYISSFLSFASKNKSQKPIIKTQFLKNKTLNMIQLRIVHHYQNQGQTEIQSQASEKSKRSNFLNNYLNQSVKKNIHQAGTQCLGCVQYFYQKSQFYYDISHSFYEVDNISLTESQKLTEAENHIKALICSFLNKEKGGIILIGCDRVGTRIEISGVELTEIQKQSVQQRIQKYMEVMKPNIRRSRQIGIDFVPIYRSPYQSIVQDQIQGMYVIRVRIIPSQFTKMYYYELKGDLIFSDWRVNGVADELQMKSCYSIMHEKYKRNQRVYNENSGKIDNKSQKIVYSHYSINCLIPIKKKQFTQDDRKNRKKDDYSSKHKQEVLKFKPKQIQTPKKQPKIQHEPKTIIDKCSKYITLMVADEHSKDVFLKCCSQDQKISDISIKKFDYKNSDLPQTKKKTWAVYHNVKFQRLKKLIELNHLKSINQSKKKDKKDNKAVHLIATHKYILVQSTKNSNYLQFLSVFQNELKKNIQDGKIQRRATFYENDKGYKKNYAILSELIEFNSLEAAIFAYFYFSKHDYKAIFKRGATYLKQKQESPDMSQTVQSYYPQMGYQNQYGQVQQYSQTQSEYYYPQNYQNYQNNGYYNQNYYGQQTNSLNQMQYQAYMQQPAYYSETDYQYYQYPNKYEEENQEQQ